MPREGERRLFRRKADREREQEEAYATEKPLREYLPVEAPAAPVPDPSIPAERWAEATRPSGEAGPAPAPDERPAGGPHRAPPVDEAESGEVGETVDAAPDAERRAEGADAAEVLAPPTDEPVASRPLPAEREPEPTPLVPSIAGRVDNLHTVLASLKLSVDALAQGTATSRSVLTDRLNEFADELSRSTRTQANDLDEYRRSNDRTLTELRREAADSDEALRRLNTRVEDVALDLSHVADLLRRSAADSEEVTRSSQRLLQELQEGLGQFTDRLVERLDDLSATLGRDLAATRAESSRTRSGVAELRGLLDLPPDDEAMEILHTLLDDTKQRAAADPADPALAELLHGLRADVGALQDALASAPSSPAGELAALRDEVASLRKELADRPPAASGGVDPGDLAALRDDIAALNRRITLRGRADQFDDDELDSLASALGDRLEQMFEVVPDEPQADGD